MSSLSDGDKVLLIDLSVVWLLLEGKRAWFPFALTKRFDSVELAYANLDDRYFSWSEDSGQPLSSLSWLLVNLLLIVSLKPR